MTTKKEKIRRDNALPMLGYTVIMAKAATGDKEAMTHEDIAHEINAHARKEEIDIPFIQPHQVRRAMAGIREVGRDLGAPIIAERYPMASNPEKYHKIKAWRAAGIGDEKFIETEKRIRTELRDGNNVNAGHINQIALDAGLDPKLLTAIGYVAEFVHRARQIKS